MPRRKSNARGIRRYDDGGSVSDSGSSSGATGASGSSTASGLSSYYGMMSQLRGSLGGSRDSPYATTKGGNAYYSKGGKVGAKPKPKTRRKR